jgi:hypothetical protein
MGITVKLTQTMVLIVNYLASDRTSLGETLWGVKGTLYRERTSSFQNPLNRRGNESWEDYQVKQKVPKFCFFPNHHQSQTKAKKLGNGLVLLLLFNPRL